MPPVIFIVDVVVVVVVVVISVVVVVVVVGIGYTSIQAQTFTIRMSSQQKTFR